MFYSPRLHLKINRTQASQALLPAITSQCPWHSLSVLDEQAQEHGQHRFILLALPGWSGRWSVHMSHEDLPTDPFEMLSTAHAWKPFGSRRLGMREWAVQLRQMFWLGVIQNKEDNAASKTTVPLQVFRLLFICKTTLSSCVTSFNKEQFSLLLSSICMHQGPSLSGSLAVHSS